MQKTIMVLNQMQADDVIGGYAISGAMAAIYYTEPVLTEDLDVIISFGEPELRSASGGLLTLGPISEYLAERGYTEWRKEGLMVEGWPVQFLPTADALDEEALEQAEEVTLDMGDGAVQTRVLRAKHLAAIALRTGRAKDFLRIIQLWEAGSLIKEDLILTIQRYSLNEKWQQFSRLYPLDAETGSE